jgi:outer membrane protein OmpA-like peptidoglycan-associated protein
MSHSRCVRSNVPRWSSILLCACLGCGASQAPAAAARPSALATREPAAPRTASSLSSHGAMQSDFAYATAARDAVIEGRMNRVQAPLLALAKSQLGSDMPSDWLPWLRDMQATAQQGASATTLGDAATSVATLANACGECHRTTGGGQHRAADVARSYEPEDKKGLVEKMARHQFSADALWMGLVGPDHKAWAAGAAALMNISVPGLVDLQGTPATGDRRPSGVGSLQGTVDPRLPDQEAASARAKRGNIDLDVALRQLRELGTRADQAKTAHDKTQVFAELITRCGNCHAALGIRDFGAHKRVEITADKLVITEKIQFDFDTATIKPVSYALLDEIAAAIDTNPQLRKISIEGHTDSTGEDAYNLKLSQARAAAVLGYLVSHGIDSHRLSATGFGEEKPIASNDDEDGREANRRVEFLITEQETLKHTYDVDPATRRGTPLLSP